MNALDYLLLLACVGLLSIAQVLQKEVAVQINATQSWSQQFVSLSQSRPMLLAIVCMATSTLLWFVLLYRNEVSQVFPWLSLCMVLVVISARWRFHERISGSRWTGIVLVVAGITVVSAS